MRIINIALFSFGMSGRVFHAPFIAIHPGFKLVGVLERNKQESLEFYPDIHIYRSLEEVLNDSAVELVVVNTPTNTHYEFTRQALMAGKQVIVEKAFTTTAEEARELHHIAQRQKRMLSVYQNRRWDSDFSTVRQVVEDGLLGSITEAEFHFDRYKIALSSKQHKEIPGPGAGLLNDLGPHLIDQALSLFGMPQNLFADIRTIRPDSQVDDCFTITLFYDDKRVILKSSLLVKEPLPAFVVHGTKGSFIKSRADVQEAALLANVKPSLVYWGTEPESAQGLLHTEVNGRTIREHVHSLQGNYYHYYEGIYQALTRNIEPPVTARDGINVMEIIEAARMSSRNQAVVAVS
ncbi:MAG: Gfo/Idh/MocA family oxidoreductase [Sphingobacteriia bacterium]|nr:Gfo/Idh/MocA family oxidoreductase [Sphingobacteriia bacterium]